MDVGALSPMLHVRVSFQNAAAASGRTVGESRPFAFLRSP
jgi:hypothetical protein